MAWAMVAGAAITVVGGAISANQKKKAAQGAANAQTAADDKAIAEQQRQFDAMQKLLSPYVQGGEKGLSGQQDFLGLNGQAAQQGAVNGIQNSAQFDALAKQGENGILQNASATGGLRGGNTEGALAQFRPQLLNGLIDQQYSRLGGLAQMGQASAAGVGVAGMQSGDAITKLLQNQGAAQAGGILANGAANAQFANTAVGALGQFIGGKF